MLFYNFSMGKLVRFILLLENIDQYNFLAIYGNFSRQPRKLFRALRFSTSHIVVTRSF